MRYEGDPSKSASNLRKHRVSFLVAATVSTDPLAVTFEDPDHSSAEERFITIGTSSSGRLLFVAHADRDGDIRTTKARKPTHSQSHDDEEGSLAQT